jgi:hypothetical protein
MSEENQTQEKNFLEGAWAAIIVADDLVDAVERKFEKVGFNAASAFNLLRAKLDEVEASLIEYYKLQLKKQLPVINAYTE